MQNDPEYEAIRRRVQHRLFLRATFIFNLIFSFLITLLLLPEWNRDEQSRIGVSFFFLIWGALLIAHGAAAFGWFRGLIDRAAQRERSHRPLPGRLLRETLAGRHGARPLRRPSAPTATDPAIPLARLRLAP